LTAGLTVVPSAKDGLHCGSALRSGQIGWRCVVPSAKDGLHCGAAKVAREAALREVVPSAKGGLHCGCQPRGHAVRAVTSSRPPRTGSIAA